ncbi:hypothetical protein EDB83DRAFT_2314311 [Lactarius deliciosus]|nr:hypothetical protein EDB83DRAFT_2314311 [Lactarius deliciosus]
MVAERQPPQVHAGGDDARHLRPRRASSSSASSDQQGQKGSGLDDAVYNGNSTLALARRRSCSQTIGPRHLPLPPPRLHPSRGVVAAELMNWGARAVSELAGGRVDRPVASVLSGARASPTPPTTCLTRQSISPPLARFGESRSKFNFLPGLVYDKTEYGPVWVVMDTVLAVGSSRGVWGYVIVNDSMSIRGPVLEYRDIEIKIVIVIIAAMVAELVVVGQVPQSVAGVGVGSGRDARRPCAQTAAPHSKNPAKSRAVASVAFCALDLEDQANVQVTEFWKGRQRKARERVHVRGRDWRGLLLRGGVGERERGHVKRYGLRAAIDDDLDFVIRVIYHALSFSASTDRRVRMAFSHSMRRHRQSIVILVRHRLRTRRVSTKRRILPLGAAGADAEAEAAALGWKEGRYEDVTVTLAGVKLGRINFWRGGRGASLMGHTEIQGRGASGAPAVRMQRWNQADATTGTGQNLDCGKRRRRRISVLGLISQRTGSGNDGVTRREQRDWRPGLPDFLIRVLYLVYRHEAPTFSHPRPPDCCHTLDMSQPPAPVSIPQAPATTSSRSSSNVERIFDAALKSYNKKTKNDLKNHDMFKQLETCNSPAAILAVFQAAQFDPSRTAGHDSLKKWLVPTINVLYAFSGTLGEGVALVFPPAKVVFAGVGVLLLAAKDVAASKEILVDIFGRIESFFVRLEIYTEVPLTPAMTDKMVQITVEILDILATATKEMERSRAKKFLKKVAGWTDLEDGLKKLDKMTKEEAVMANAQVLKVTHKIDDKVTRVGEDVRSVDEKVQVVEGEVQVVKGEVQLVNDNVKSVDDKVQAIAEDSMEVKSIIQQTADQVDNVKRNQLRESLRKWQSPPDPSTNHNIAGDRQHGGTAEWLFESNQFKSWKLTGSLLWIHGKPGSGKSVLCSAIINDITTMCEAGSASMAYFYFDFRDLDKQARRNLLPSLLIQLSTRSNTFCDIHSRLYETHDNGARQPSDRALIQCLKEMLTLPNQGPIYLILDALDECPDSSDVPSAREQVLDLVKDLVSLRLSNLHICVTSRPEADIRDALESLASQTVSLQEERGQKKDIASYVKSVVYSDSGKFMKRWRKEDKERVIATLSERADGMFRWVFCQLEMLRNCLPQNVQRVLRELPNSLDETYERMLREIGMANPDQAHRLLQCLTVATRPLRVDELAEVLALDFDGAKGGIPALNSDWRWDDQQQGVLSTCSSLVVIVYNNYWKTHVVQFAHFSVKEFLTSGRLANLTTDISRFHIRLEPAHTIIARACLATLLQSNYNDTTTSSSPLSNYAARHWVDHAQFENVSLGVKDGMRRLFDPTKPYFAAWVKSFNIDKRWYSFVHVGPDPLDAPSESTSSSETYAPLCLYYAASCGFHDPTKHLIAKYPQHVNARVGLNKSPLAAALGNKHIQVAELLHQHGTVLHVGYKSCTLLHAASEDGLMNVMRMRIGTTARPHSTWQRQKDAWKLFEPYWSTV